MRGQKEKAADWWLANIPEWGAVRIRQILTVMGNSEAVYDRVQQAVKEHISPDAFREELVRQRTKQIWQHEPKRQWERWIITKENIAGLMQSIPRYESCREAYEKWIRSGGRFVTVEDEEYPERLLPYPDCPFALYYRGKLPAEKRGTAAVIGARACSQYGRRYARQYARELAMNGIQIISGLAYGIDSEGHRGALESGVPGSTYAILGCGPDFCYPKEHEDLYEEILAQGGGILSEYAPGVGPLPQHFPMRNRIISGLSDCVLVMEARKKSGSLITVDLALDQGKEIFALPGRTGDALSEGCLQLIRNGAGILTDCQEVLEYLQGRRFTWSRKEETGREENKNCAQKQENDTEDSHVQKEYTHKDQIQKEQVTETEEDNPWAVSSQTMKQVLEALEAGEQNMEGILTQTGLPLSIVQEAILELLLEDRIEEIAVGYYLRKNLRH